MNFKVKTDFAASSGMRCILTVQVVGTQVAVDADWGGLSTERDRQELEGFIKEQLAPTSVESSIVEDDETRARKMSEFLRRRKPEAT